MEKAKKPKIRFKGFTNDWEQENFFDTFSCTVPNNTLSRAELNNEYGLIKNIHYGDILIKYNTTVDISKNDIPYLMDSNIDDYKSFFLKNGDIIIADTAEDETTGKAVEVINATNQYVVSGLHTIVCRPKKEKQPYFLGYYINSPSYHQQLLPLLQGIKVYSISKLNLGKTIVCFPSMSKEQLYIGKIFKNLDKLITLHQRKCEKLQNIKKSLLEKMFPKNDEKFPAIRFKGFTNAWEQNDLGNLSDVRDGTHESPKYISNGYPLITSKNLKNGQIDYKDVQYISYLDFININKRSKVDINDILMGMIGTIGNIALIHDTPCFAIKNVALIKNKDHIYYLFLYQILQSNNVLYQLDNEIDGGTQKFIALNKVRVLKINFPQKKEQMYIANFLESLDKLITFHQRQVEKLQNIKTALLEKMFV